MLSHLTPAPVHGPLKLVVWRSAPSSRSGSEETLSNGNATGSEADPLRERGQLAVQLAEHAAGRQDRFYLVSILLRSDLPASLTRLVHLAEH